MSFRRLFCLGSARVPAAHAAGALVQCRSSSRWGAGGLVFALRAAHTSSTRRRFFEGFRGAIGLATHAEPRRSGRPRRNRIPVDSEARRGSLRRLEYRGPCGRDGALVDSLTGYLASVFIYQASPSGCAVRNEFLGVRSRFGSNDESLWDQSFQVVFPDLCIDVDELVHRALPLIRIIDPRPDSSHGMDER